MQATKVSPGLLHAVKMSHNLLYAANVSTGLITCCLTNCRQLKCQPDLLLSRLIPLLLKCSLLNFLPISHSWIFLCLKKKTVQFQVVYKHFKPYRA